MAAAYLILVRSMRRHLLILLCLAVVGPMGSAHAEEVSKPSGLRPPCHLVDIIMFSDDFSSFHMDVIDREGNKLRFSYGAKGVYFNSKDKSIPGNSEEQALLEILKNALPTVNDSALAKKPAFSNMSAKDQRYWNEETVRYAIKVLERRCLTKAELKYDEIK